MSEELKQLPEMQAIGLHKMDPLWYDAFSEEFEKPYFRDLANIVKRERGGEGAIFPREDPIYPAAVDVFSWTRFCSITDVKVVIVGQDPYPSPNRAHGLAFSVKKPDFTPPCPVIIPATLQNIFAELYSDIPNFKIPGHGDLTEWAKQGVLLLNSFLTVHARKPTSHRNIGWELFTRTVIEYINDRCDDGIVFLLWGKHAIGYAPTIHQDRHHVLTSSHPAQQSARNSLCTSDGQLHPPFLGCKHFSRTNALLETTREKINWHLSL